MRESEKTELLREIELVVKDNVRRIVDGETIEEEMTLDWKRGWWINQGNCVVCQPFSTKRPLFNIWASVPFCTKHARDLGILW